MTRHFSSKNILGTKNENHYCLPFLSFLRIVSSRHLTDTYYYFSKFTTGLLVQMLFAKQLLLVIFLLSLLLNVLRRFNSVLISCFFIFWWATISHHSTWSQNIFVGRTLSLSKKETPHANETSIEWTLYYFLLKDLQAKTIFRARRARQRKPINGIATGHNTHLWNVYIFYRTFLNETWVPLEFN